MQNWCAIVLTQNNRSPSEHSPLTSQPHMHHTVINHLLYL